MAEGASESYSHAQIDKTLKATKDIQAMLCLPHLEKEPVLLHDHLWLPDCGDFVLLPPHPHRRSISTYSEMLKVGFESLMAGIQSQEIKWV